VKKSLLTSVLLLLSFSLVFAAGDTESPIPKTVVTIYYDGTVPVLCVDGPTTDVHAYLEGVIETRNSPLSRAYLYGQLLTESNSILCPLDIMGNQVGETYSTENTFSNVPLGPGTTTLSLASAEWGATWDRSESFYQVTINRLADVPSD